MTFDLARARKLEAVDELLALAYQYRDDLRFPPTGDSKERRLARIEEVISKAEGR